MRQIYGDVGWRSESSELHISIIGAANNLTGNGGAPVELLAASRSAVFTTPDQTRNKYLRLDARVTHEANDDLSLQASVYYSNLSQRTSNGDAADAVPCDDNPGQLCTGGSALTMRGGNPIGNFLLPGFYPASSGFTNGGPYSILNKTATDTNGAGVAIGAKYVGPVLGLPNRLLLGANFDGGITSFTASAQLGALSLDRAFIGPGVTIAQADGSIAPVSVQTSNAYYGLYASDTLDITPALSLNVSGRANMAQIDLQDRIGTALTGNHSFSHFNPAAGLTYRLATWLSAYAGFAGSNRTPTPAELSCASSTIPCTLTNFFVSDPSLRQVVAATFEAGFRGTTTLGNARIGWNAGLFHTDSKDDILFTLSNVTGHGYFQNVGLTRRQGTEAGISVRQRGLVVFLNYAYTDATFQTVFTESSQDNPQADANGLIHIRHGNQLPGVPRHLVKFGAQFDITEAWAIGGAGIAAAGRYLTGDEANLTAKTSYYIVLNLNTNYRVTEHVEIFALVQNVLNARYATSGGFSLVSLVPIIQVHGGATNTRSLAPGAPVAGFRGGGVRVSF